MRGVQFGEYHTADDWGLILNAKSIDPPTPKYVKVSVDGRDGDLNLSRALTGDLKYNNRGASFTFLVTEGTQAERAELIREITNIVHGKELQIIEPDNEDYYLLGECLITDIGNDKAYGYFTIEADCEPYYYAINEIARTVSATSTPTDIVLNNTGRRTLIPTVTVTGSANLVIGSASVSLSAGTYKLPALILAPIGRRCYKCIKFFVTILLFTIALSRISL